MIELTLRDLEHLIRIKVSTNVVEFGMQSATRQKQSLALMQTGFLKGPDYLSITERGEQALSEAVRQLNNYVQNNG